VAIVAIFAMTLRNDRGGTITVVPGPAGGAAVQPTAPKAAAVDVATLRATDGQPLGWVDNSPLKAPPRPADPAKLPDDHLLRWYDYEYSGWNVQKLPMPVSPGTGPRGKKVVSLQYMDHPYWTGYRTGMTRMADAYGMELTIMEAGNDNKVQADQVEQVIRMRPDLVILTPVDSNGVVPMLKRLYEEKIPVIASNLLPVDEGMKYVITWTGPDDWGQFRMLAREFARQMNDQGGYCVVRHLAGTSCYLSRTWAPVSELKQVAPNMKCLDMQSTDLKTEETKTQVAAWLKKYGSELKGIVSADDSKAMVGIAEALKDAGRNDVICVSAGTSRTGVEFVKAGKLQAMTYQSAEGDGALPICIAADWFSGKKIARPVYFLQKHIITAKDVDQFMPAQW
ncbi:MAG: sugar ABC transporter substrate-binding protein, partial [Tepidisphaeraceae bacterium]